MFIESLLCADCGTLLFSAVQSGRNLPDPGVNSLGSDPGVNSLGLDPGVTAWGHYVLPEAPIVNFLLQSHPGRQATLRDRVGSAVPFPTLFPVAASIPKGPPLLPCV